MLPALPLFTAETKITNVTLGIIILLLALLILLVILILTLLLHHRRRNPQAARNSDPPLVITSGRPKTITAPARTTTTSLKKPSLVVQRDATLKKAAAAAVAAEEANQLMFLREEVERFELQDLLRASAEVLGSGTFGASYKAGVRGEGWLVVKRYRHMNNVGREEFHQHMRRIGGLNHQNLLPVLACYYRKEEKLLVSNFVPNGSLATRLHGNHSSEQGLDWPTRLKIIKGITKGLAYLHKELPITIPHGHLKSSNVLLSDSFEPMLTDYALRPVINPDHAQKLMIAYKSPEHFQHGRTSSKTDVWSLGIVMLEILTGKYPENYLTQGYNASSDLATWVNNMVKDKKTSEVFDKDMAPGNDSCKGEMIKVLKVALSCCEEDVERRVEIEEVVRKIEQLVDDGHDDSGNDN